jgi:hypothetical protein
METQVPTVIDVLSNLPVQANPEDFAAVSKGSAFLPRLQLFGGNSCACKEGKIPIGRYGIVRSKDQVDDVGSEVDILPVAFRPKAMRITEDGILVVYKLANPEFAKIQALSDTKDSGCMAGPEYLIWVPSRLSFVTFFMASKTARREAPNMQALLKKPTTLKAQLIKTAKYMWHGPVITMCSTPFEMPNIISLQEEVTKFISPPETEVETVEEGADARDR